MKKDIPLSEKETYSVNEFAALTGLCRQSVYNELNSGRLPSFKLGARRLIPREAIQKWKSELMGGAA